MDEITRSVREMYERYPYPAGGAQVRAASDARLVMSYVERSRSRGGPIHVLDAGCGRALGTLGAAATQPDVSFVGIDINRVALKDAVERARLEGLKNVRFQECDLMTLEGLEVPEGGFDVIYSLGVVHHMSDPLAGLRKLREVLVPHGAVTFMVYAEHGRVPLKRVTNAIDLLVSKDAPIEERVALGRALAELAKDGILSNTFWENTSRVNDVEFVDRCLNVNEACYDVASLWELISGAGMRFIRWIEPEMWSVDKLFPEGEARARAARLGPLEQYKLIEQLFGRNAFEMILSRGDNTPRRPLDAAEMDTSFFAVNPDVCIVCERRNLHGAQRIESLAVKLRHREPVGIPRGPLATALLALENQREPFPGEAWVEAMGRLEMPGGEARAVLAEFVNREIVFRPHPREV